jgi:SAM-dependent methyltransferase
MTDHWDKKWDELKKDVRPRSNLDGVSRAIFNFMDHHVPRDPKKLLETGCGTGRFCFAMAQAYPDAKVTGTDMSNDSIELCRKSSIDKKLPNTDFHVMDIYGMDFKDGTFDAAFCEGVLQHIPDDLKGLKEMVRVTRPGGSVMASVVNWNNFPHTIYKTLRGKTYEMYPERSYRHSQLIELFKKAGLKDIEIYGVYPGYGMQRIEGYLPLLGPIIAQLMYLMAFAVDRFTNNWFSNQFGIQIVAKGVKQ